MEADHTLALAEPAAAAKAPLQRQRIYRRNFAYLLADGILFSVAMSIISPTTTVPDFVRRLTDSEILIGLTGSLFSIGYTLPQLFVARYIVRHERKKWWFAGPNIPVRFMILLFAAITVWLGQDRPQLILLAFFICYSIAAIGDGVVGVPWADLIGTSLDNRWRARLHGTTTAATGVITLLLAPLVGIVLGAGGPEFPNDYALLFGAAGVIFVISILPGLFLHELPGGKAVEKVVPYSEFLPHLGRVLRDDVPYRAYIVIRVFTSMFRMAAPFYIGFATVQLGLSSEVAVPMLLAMQTLGSVAGAVAYVWLGARSNVLYIQVALGCAVLLPICALLAEQWGPPLLYFGFLLSGLTTTNLLSAYLNWLVSYADGEQRPVYVGLSNTVAAVVSLIAPFLGGVLAQRFGYRPLFAVAMVMALGALVVTLRYLHEPLSEETPTAAIGST